MGTDAIPDRSTAFGERVHRRLAEEQVIWLTTVGRDIIVLTGTAEILQNHPSVMDNPRVSRQVRRGD